MRQENGPTEPALELRRRTLKRIDAVVGAVLIVLFAGGTLFLGVTGALVGPEVLPPQALPPQVLSPATALPALALCSEHLTYAADGNASPLTCDESGSRIQVLIEINVLAWKFFAAHKPSVMALGPNASARVVETAICADMSNVPIPIERSAVSIAYIYYRWSYVRFGNINPMAVVAAGGCARACGQPPC